MARFVSYFLVFLSVLFQMHSAQARSNRPDDFVKTQGAHFTVGGRSYYYIGVNFWAAMNLGATADGRKRLERELNRLKSIGVLNLRILGGSEGPDSEPWRIVPSVQKSPGQFDENLLIGLDFTLAEMNKRGMRAVICLNNFWHWSGGMAQYLRWAGEGAIPYPPPAPNGNWAKFQLYSSQFYSNAKATAMFDRYVQMLLSRKNTITDQAYADDPTIMSWELANEPRATRNASAFNKWISHMGALIKSIDHNHLVTTGSEGETGYPLLNGMDFAENHSDPNIDYTTAHIWIQNAGWYDPAKPEQTYPSAFEKAKAYLADHMKKAAVLKKPLVVEEFGIARDGGSFDPFSPTVYRDRYYEFYFNEVNLAAFRKSPLAGVNFWAWSGEATPPMPYGGNWKAGDPFLGDPPHEPQGWYGVYATDKSTLKLIETYTRGLWWIRWWWG